MNKVYPDAQAALHDVFDGAVVLAGGFGLSGNPENCIHELARRKVTGLTIVSNNCGTTDKGLGILLAQGQVKKMVSSYVGENKIFEQQFLSGQLEVELCPQGTLAERLRAGGAGIEAFFTPTGFGTKVAEGKETRVLAGKPCVMETAIRGDFAIVKAWKGDHWGNLVFRKTSRNFNPLVATAGKVTIVEVEQLVEVGALDPDQVHLPSIYVHRIFQGRDYEKPIEQRTVRKASEASVGTRQGGLAPDAERSEAYPVRKASEASVGTRQGGLAPDAERSDAYPVRKASEASVGTRQGGLAPDAERSEAYPGRKP